MPNWCEDDLFVKGGSKETRRFVKYAAGDGSPLDFNRFIPYPDGFLRADRNRYIVSALGPLAQILEIPVQKDGYNSGGYEWCVANWGTKWNASSPVVRITKTGATYRFSTAWSPPTPIIIMMSEMFPRLKFTLKYYEAGMAFQGVFTCKAGRVVTDDHYTYCGGRGG